LAGFAFVELLFSEQEEQNGGGGTLWKVYAWPFTVTSLRMTACNLYAPSRLWNSLPQDVIADTFSPTSSNSLV